MNMYLILKNDFYILGEKTHLLTLHIVLLAFGKHDH